MKQVYLFKRLFASFVLLLMTTLSWAYDFVVDGIYYNKNTDGTSVAVTFKDNNYFSYSGSIVIPSIVAYDAKTYDVTSIGDNAFRLCPELTSITIPESVTSIGDDAFRSCIELTSITVPENVTSIGRYAFDGCVSLPVIDDLRYADTYLVEAVDKSKSTYNIKEGTRTIGREAFNYSSLQSIIIPNSVKSIGEEAFYGCSGLTSVTIPNSVTSIGDYAFRGCTSLPVIDNLRYADTYLVEAVDKSKSTYNIKEGTRFIGSEAFFDCSTLTFVNIPNSVESLCYRAFYSCRSLASVTIPSNVKNIGHLVFFDCVALSSLTIPNHVVSIGEYAFANCSGLSSIKVADGNTNYDSRNNCNAIIETKSNTLITGCKNSTIPNGVIKIGNQAFRGYHDLTSITIPSSVKSIDSFVFGNCSGLKSLTCLAIDAPNMGSDVFFYVPLSTVTLYVPAGSVDAYKAAAQWKEFGNIVGIDPTAVEELKSNKTLKANDNAPIYDLMGRRLQQKPASGYYIQGGKKYFVK